MGKVGAGRLISIYACFVFHRAIMMEINLVDFFIIQAAITIAVHLLGYLDNAALNSVLSIMASPLRLSI